MSNCYIIVQQYTKQEHASPTSFITKLPMQQDLYTEKHGDTLKHNVFVCGSLAWEECARLNKEENPYIEYTVIKGNLV